MAPNIWCRAAAAVWYVPHYRVMPCRPWLTLAMASAQEQIDVVARTPTGKLGREYVSRIVACVFMHRGQSLGCCVVE